MCLTKCGVSAAFVCHLVEVENASVATCGYSPATEI